MDKIKEFFNNISEEVKTGLLIAGALIIIFSLGNFAGSLTNIHATTSGEGNFIEIVGVAENTPAEVATTQAPVTAATVPTAPAEVPTTAGATQPAGETATTAAASPSTGAPSTNAEILALFNESANKIKTGATKATRNYQDIRVENIELPSALQSLGDTLVAKFVTPNFTPIEWTGADIAANYPVGGMDYVSKLTEADIASATCKDNGTEYEVVIAINAEQDPVPDSGLKTNAIFWVMNPATISENVPGMQSSSVAYHDCKVTAKIDKATGNMTYALYEFRFDIDVTIKVLATLNAGVDVAVDEEYVIAY